MSINAALTSARRTSAQIGSMLGLHGQLTSIHCAAVLVAAGVAGVTGIAVVAGVAGVAGIAWRVTVL